MDVSKAILHYIYIEVRHLRRFLEGVTTAGITDEVPTLPSEIGACARAAKNLSSTQPQSEQATQRHVAGGNPSRQNYVAGWEPKGTKGRHRFETLQIS